MTIFLYKWKIKPGKEIQFENSWSSITKAIYKECGSLGSRLHVDDAGEYLAYAQWPDAETREQCVLKSDLIDEARSLMRDAIAFTYPDQVLKVKSDYLRNSASPKS